MTTLILAGEVIVAAVASVTYDADAKTYVSDDGVFPEAAGVTATATVVGDLPADFRPDRYVFRSGALVRLPDPPPTQAEIDAAAAKRRAAYTAEADPLFFSWQAAKESDAPDQDARRLAWRAKRAEIQARYPDPV